jgi:hypothetical protein
MIEHKPLRVFQIEVLDEPPNPSPLNRPYSGLQQGGQEPRNSIETCLAENSNWTTAIVVLKQAIRGHKRAVKRVLWSLMKEERMMRRAGHVRSGSLRKTKIKVVM